MIYTEARTLLSHYVFVNINSLIAFISYGRPE